MNLSYTQFKLYFAGCDFLRNLNQRIIADKTNGNIRDKFFLMKYVFKILHVRSRLKVHSFGGVSTLVRGY